MIRDFARALLDLTADSAVWAWRWRRRRRCPHDRQRGIYGDEILTARARARCLDCGTLLPTLPSSD